MSRFEVHYTDRGYVDHVLVDAVGLADLRAASGSGVPPDSYASVYSPLVAPLTGVAVYVDDCPCSKVVSGGA